MAIFRNLVTFGPFASLVPLLARLDSTVLCARHLGSSHRGKTTLRNSASGAATRVLTALASAPINRAIERERHRLLADKQLLGQDTPFDAAVTVSEACAVSKSPRQAALLAAIVRAFSPRHAIELGTNVGISSAYIASAMEGTLVTLEGSTCRHKLARELHVNLGLTNVEYVTGMFADTLRTALDQMPEVDFAFIDGHHEYQATLDYSESIIGRAKPGAVFVFDDIRWSPGMHAAWSRLKADPRFGLVVDFWSMGVGVLRTGNESHTTTEPITCY